MKQRLRVTTRGCHLGYTDTLKSPVVTLDKFIKVCKILYKLVVFLVTGHSSRSCLLLITTNIIVFWLQSYFLARLGLAYISEYTIMMYFSARGTNEHLQ